MRTVTITEPSTAASLRDGRGFEVNRGNTMVNALAICAVLAISLSAVQTHAATIHVPDDYDTIQQAINASSNDDTIVVADGVWKGGGNTGLHTLGKRIKLRSDNGPENCIIDCQGDGRGFNLHEGEDHETRIVGFTVRNGNAEYGGAVRVFESSPKILDCIFKNNTSGVGGAVYCDESWLIIKDCRFINNDGDIAGAVWGFESSIHLYRCRFIDNHAASHGGALYQTEYGGMSAINCLFVGNSAGGRGGAAACDNGSIRLYGCTVTGNSASQGGGCYLEPDGGVTVRSCILYQNEPDDLVEDGWGQWTNISYNLFSDEWDGDGESNIAGDPLFLDPDNGDYRLSGDSPCIDAGDNDAQPDDTNKDLDGNPRFVDDPLTPDTGIGFPCVDMGAYEYSADYIIVPDDYDTIQRAINNSGDGDTIIVADGVWTGAGNHEIHTRGKRITLRSESGPENCIIDCQGEYRGFNIYEGEDADTRIEGFTVCNCAASVGRAVTLFTASPTIVNCVFKDNTGGAIHCDEAYPLIEDCLFLNNETTGNGGAVFAFEAGPKLHRCRFMGNTASTGGAIFTDDYGGISAYNCLFVGNSAAKGGVSSCWEGGTIRLSNCTATGNSASVRGGACYVEGVVKIQNSIVCQNEPEDVVDYNGSNWTSSYYSLIGDGWTGNGEGNVEGDPLFVAPDNGDYRLSGPSPCIDAADNTAVLDDVTTDLDGNTRFVDDPCIDDTGIGDPPIVDMGAYERQVSEMCPADVNCDQTVDINDVFAIFGAWGTCDNCPEDVDDTGIVDVDDIFAILAEWGPCD